MTQEDIIISEEAAKILNVSMEFLNEALNKGDLAYEQKDSSRYIKSKDIEEYNKKLNIQRKAAVQEVTKRAVKAGLYKNRKSKSK